MRCFRYWFWCNSEVYRTSEEKNTSAVCYWAPVACRMELSHFRSIQRMCILSNKQTLVCGAAASSQIWKDNVWFVWYIMFCSVKSTETSSQTSRSLYMKKNWKQVNFSRTRRLYIQPGNDLLCCFLSTMNSKSSHRFRKLSKILVFTLSRKVHCHCLTVSLHHVILQSWPQFVLT